MTHQQIKNCVEACIACATSCNHCAVSCLEEENVKNLTKCIKLDLECAAMCKAVAELLNIEGAYSKELCQLCVAICNACAEECEKHAKMGMEHCEECAEACRACAKETMAIYQELEAQDHASEENQRFLVTSEECAIFSRVAAELLSLKSSYANQLLEINASACHAASEDLQNHSAMRLEHSNSHATIAKEAHEELKNQDKGEKTDDPVLPKQELHKNSKKHSSALLAASVWRSPTDHARSHVNFDVRGRRSRITNTGPFFTI